MNKQKAFFITFEGIDRCGKSTQVQQLKRSLNAKGIRILVTAEPGGSGQLGVALRELLLDPNIPRDEKTASMLFYADRIEHIQKVINPTLAKGIWVLCDRFHDSTFAYQGAGGNVDQSLLEQLDSVAREGLTPDLTVLFLIETETRLKRNPKLDYYDQGRKSFDIRVMRCFEERAKAEPDRFLVIDGSASIEAIAEKILKEVCRRFLSNIEAK